MAAFLVPLLLAAADAPITVVGHAWAPFISPMGEPFRARSTADDTLARWFQQADRNHDGVLTVDEMQADAGRFFATLDENNDGDPANDGAGWHSHWVVLGKDAGCAAGLKVLDVSPGVDVLPTTAPMLPLALDSPGMSPALKGKVAKITVPLKGAAGAAFDAVTAELQVNAEGKAPLLCVTGVTDVASGDLSMPGRIEEKK